MEEEVKKRAAKLVVGVQERSDIDGPSRSKTNLRLVQFDRKLEELAITVFLFEWALLNPRPALC